MTIRAGRHTMLWPPRVIFPVWTQSWVGQSDAVTCAEPGPKVTRSVQPLAV